MDAAYATKLLELLERIAVALERQPFPATVFTASYGPPAQITPCPHTNLGPPTTGGRFCYGCWKWVPHEVGG